MERMLRPNKDNTDYEIDRELTGKFAIEKNAGYQEKIEQLEQEKKNLSELNRKQSKAFKETMKDYRELLRDYMKIGEENKKLKSDLAFERTMLDNVKAEYKSLQNVIKKLKVELSKNKVERWSLKKDCENKIEQQKIALKSMENQIRELKETLNHRDSFFSIMRDVLENEKLKFDFYELREILYCVVHEECGDYDLSEKELEVVKKFWDREYV